MDLGDEQTVSRARRHIVGQPSIRKQGRTRRPGTSHEDGVIRSHCFLIVAALLVVGLPLARPLVGAALTNLSSISVVQWMLGDDLAGVRAGVSLTHLQRLAQLTPRQAGRVLRFQALAASPPPAVSVRPTELYERLRIAQQQGNFEQTQVVERQLVGLQPRYPLGAPTPVEALPGWTLLGYDLARPMLGPLSTVAIVLYWQRDVALEHSPGATRIGDWDWVWAGRRVYQIGSVENLAPNGGFEGQLDITNGYTPGWGHYIENCAVPPSLVVLPQHPERPSVVLSLVSGSDPCRVYSRRTPLPTSGPYLLSAWLLMEGDKNSQACIGYTWWGVTKGAFCTSEPQWTHRATIILPRPEDDTISLYVAVDGRAARAYFEDVLFFPLDLQALGEFDTGP